MKYVDEGNKKYLIELIEEGINNPTKENIEHIQDIMSRWTNSVLKQIKENDLK